MLHGREDYNNRIQDSEGLIPEDEPVLLLRGQDALGIAAVKAYLKTCKANNIKNVDELEAHLQKMMDWPIKKMPDVPKYETRNKDRE